MRCDENGLDLLNQVEKTDNFYFSKHTTYGLGGKARIAYFPKTELEAAAVLKHLKQSGETYEILGNGSNVLASNKFFDGAVVSSLKLKGIEIIDDCLYCKSGITVNELLKFCVCNGIGGFEYLAGIPATLGGLAAMNGGINTKHIAEDILSVRVCDGEIAEISNRNCDFGNKRSTMLDIKALILGLKMSFSAVPREAVKEKIDFYLNKRLMQPKGKSCGCVFKNPQNDSAGKLIDECGLKGFELGGAKVSEIHANFIINSGVNAADVYRLIKEVKRIVFERKGILLEEEVVYIGEFDEING